jgi:hypothetical protein
VIRRHVGAEALAAYRDGALRGRKASRTRAHLAGCRRCAALGEDLAGVSAILAGTHAPPMPEHLTARIQAALASEARNRAALPGQAKQAARDPVRPRLPSVPGRVALGALAAAAAVAVLAGGGYEIAQHVGGAAASAPSAGKIAMGSHRAATASGPAVPYRHAGHTETVTPIATTTDFAAGQLTQQVSAQLAQDRNAALNQGGLRAGAPISTVPVQPARPSNTPQSFRNLSLTALQGCVSRISAGSLVLLVDVAHYQGAPATVIVTRASAGSPELVWVVGSGCSGTRSDLLARVTLPAGG